jgi:hypothetical protein
MDCCFSRQTVMSWISMVSRVTPLTAIAGASDSALAVRPQGHGHDHLRQSGSELVRFREVVRDTTPSKPASSNNFFASLGKV